MKYFLMIIFFFSTFLISTHQGEVKWSSQEKLKWNDFKKKLGPSVKEYATLTGGIDFSVNQKSDSIVEVIAFAFYDKDQSGKVENSNVLTEEVLRHEQGHFDIWEWYARILREKLK